jgi:hypothetical protein
MLICAAAGCWLLTGPSPVGAATAYFLPAKDTMIFQNNPSNGAGGAPGFFAGTNSMPSIRRGLIAFDVSRIPSHATITGVELRLVIGQVAGSGGGGGPGGFDDPVIGLHKLLVDWGEADTGASNAQNLNGIGQGNPAQHGDATWNQRFFQVSGTNWAQPGGQSGVDYLSAPSASLVQANTSTPPGNVSVWTSTPELVADVQSWITSPNLNYGWMLINTDESSVQTFRGFYSHDYNPIPPSQNPGFRPRLPVANYFPRLVVTYHTPEPSAWALMLVGIASAAPWCFVRRRRRTQR